LPPNSRLLALKRTKSSDGLAGSGDDNFLASSDPLK
jgi:hypothetical protein